MKATYYYLIKLQFLGFRYSGWQRQPRVKTIEGMLIKTLKFILPGREFKILGAGRTDAKVSALEAAFELYMKEVPIEDIEEFIRKFNINLPSDIKILNINRINKNFNIIHDCTEKEYIYLFSSGAKNHPFCAPFITGLPDKLDIDLMKKGARLFEGTHDFRAYTGSPSSNKNFLRTISSSVITSNNLLQANFFPEESYALKVKGSGFLRYQVRMIMGVLFQLGKYELTPAEIESSLKPGSKKKFTQIAPGSGLHLNSLTFNKKA